jgi:Ca2+-binding RTX toxin-like protein
MLHNRPAVLGSLVVVAALAAAPAAASVRATFAGGILTVAGDDTDNVILVSANAVGALRVTHNGAMVAILVLPGSGTPHRTNTTLITVDGSSGNDDIRLDSSLNNGTSPTLSPTANASIDGGDGNDTISVEYGGFNGTLGPNGEVQGVTLGNTVVLGGSGDDVLMAGFGTDQLFGGSGNDTLIHRPGNLSDTLEGGDGSDTATVIGNGGSTSAADRFEVLRSPTCRLLVRRTNLVQFSLDLDTIETLSLLPDLTEPGGNDEVTIRDLTGVPHLQQVIVNGAGGSDVIDASAQASVVVSVVASGGPAPDTLAGGAGSDILRGDEDDDVITGGSGGDTLDGGSGNDDLSGGDGTDTLQGGSGNDRLNGGGQDGDADILGGGADADTFLEFSGEADIFLDVVASEGDVVVDGGVSPPPPPVDPEPIDCAPPPLPPAVAIVAPANGATYELDAVVLADYACANATSCQGPVAAGVPIDTATPGDKQFTVNASNDAGDTASLTNTYTVVVPPPRCHGLLVTIQGGPGNDVIQGTPGDDVILDLAGSNRVSGGGGNDTICLGDGDDWVDGGAGNDFIDAGNGNNAALGGTGDDELRSGAGSDAIDGGTGSDGCNPGGNNAVVIRCEH